MNKLVCLLKVQLLGMFGVNRIVHAGTRAQKARLAGLAAVIALVAVAAALYATTLAIGLASLGAVDALPVLAVAVGSLAGVLATFLKANGQLFGFKDFDTVVSLPVPLWQVVVSRAAALYGMNLAVATLFMMPMLVVYAQNTVLGLGGTAAFVAAIFLAPLLPMAAAILVAFALTAAATRTRHAKAAAGVFMLAAGAAVVAGVMLLTQGDPGTPLAKNGSGSTVELSVLATLGAQLAQAGEAAWPPAAWAAAGIRGNVGSFALFAIVSLAAAAATIALLSRYFLQVNALLNAGGRGKGRTSRVRKQQHVRSPFLALMGKELRQLLNTPIYLSNTVMGPLLAIAAAVTATAVGPELLAAAVHLPGAEKDHFSGLISAALPWVLTFCTALAPTGASTVSLEGSARWIMQTAPLAHATLIRSKIAVNLVVCLPAALVAGVVAAFGFAHSPAEAVAFAAAPAAGGVFASCLGTLMDARNPRYDWTSEYEVVKRSIPVMVTVLCGMALSLGGSAACVLAGEHGSTATLTCAAVLMLASAALYRKATTLNLQD